MDYKKVKTYKLENSVKREVEEQSEEDYFTRLPIINTVLSKIQACKHSSAVQLLNIGMTICTDTA